MDSHCLRRMHSRCGLNALAGPICQDAFQAQLSHLGLNSHCLSLQLPLQLQLAQQWEMSVTEQFLRRAGFDP